MKFVKKFILSLVLLSGISLGASSAKAGCSVHLGDFDWDSANIHTAISSFMIEHGYGCDVEVTKGSTTPIMAAKEYGLDEFYTNFDPGSGGALDAAIAGGFAKGQPVFSYYWTPTSLMGKPDIDMVRLEEPAYDAECWQAMSVVVEDIKANGQESYVPSCACEYKDMALTKMSTTKWAEANPEINDMIKNYSLPTPLVNEMLAYYVDESGGDMEATAMHFLSTNDVWESWVSADVAAKIKSAL